MKTDWMEYDNKDNFCDDDVLTQVPICKVRDNEKPVIAWCLLKR